MLQDGDIYKANAGYNRGLLYSFSLSLRVSVIRDDYWQYEGLNSEILFYTDVLKFTETFTFCMCSTIIMIVVKGQDFACTLMSV